MIPESFRVSRLALLNDELKRLDAMIEAHFAQPDRIPGSIDSLLARRDVVRREIAKGGVL